MNRMPLPSRGWPCLVKTIQPLWLLALVCLAFDVARADTRPNIVLFLTDDQAYSSLGCTGNQVLKTPAIDQLAAEGVLFENAFVTTAICCSSRASIFTGQHMRRHGIEDFRQPLDVSQLQNTFPALLRESGYRTAFLGKFAIGSPEVDQGRALPAELFDLWYGFPQSIAFKQMENGENQYLTTVMTDKAIGFLEESPADQPFCLVMAFKEPHGPLNYFDPEFPRPYTDAEIPLPKNMTRDAFDALPEPVRSSLNASPKWIDDPDAFRNSMRERYAYLSRADFAVGQILQALAAKGRDQNTVVIFMSDHGLMDGAHSLSGKWVMYEESIRIPLIIKDPRLPAEMRGRRSQMVLSIDVAPTILTLAGVSIPGAMQGESLTPMLASANAMSRQDWYYEHVYCPEPDRSPIPKIEGVRTHQWKYIRYTDSSPPIEELFDLLADPHEDCSLASNPAYDQVLSALRSRCDEYRVNLK